MKVIAIYDDEEIYARKLMNYVNKKSEIFHVQMFTNLKSIEEYTKKQTISLLLISEEKKKETLKELNIEQIVVLSKEIQKNLPEEYPSIYKYQSSKNIIKEILKYYKPSYEFLNKEEDIGATQLIGVYSPIKRCLKTSFAIVMGQLYGEQYKTLYINLEKFSTIEILAGKKFSSNLSDLMYYFREKGQGVVEKLDSFIESWNRLDLIPPVLNPEDIEDINSNDWQEFFKILLYKSNYKLIIVDFGEGVRGTYEILKMCHRIYMPIQADQMSTIKIDEYEKYLKATDKEDILQKTIKCKLTREGKIGLKQNYIQQLLEGEFSSQVKEILKKELI